MESPGLSTGALRALIAGQALTCTKIERDRYDRRVMRCTLPGGEDLACAMVAAGNAQDWPRYSGGAYVGC